MSTYLKIVRLAKVFAVDKERITKALDINIDKKSIKTDSVCKKLKIEPAVLSALLSRNDQILNKSELKKFVCDHTGLAARSLNEIQSIGHLEFDPCALINKTPYFSKTQTLDNSFLDLLRQRSRKINQTVEPELVGTIDTGFGSLLAEF